MEENSNRLPERDFFFGILASLKGDYLKKIISDSHSVRMKDEEDKTSKDHILIKESWLEELNKYPFISSKTSSLIFIEKPGKGIFLMKERF